jgi:hypothetical protein
MSRSVNSIQRKILEESRRWSIGNHQNISALCRTKNVCVCVKNLRIRLRQKTNLIQGARRDEYQQYP